MRIEKDYDSNENNYVEIFHLKNWKCWLYCSCYCSSARTDDSKIRLILFYNLLKKCISVHVKRWKHKYWHSLHIFFDCGYVIGNPE